VLNTPPRDALSNSIKYGKDAPDREFHLSQPVQRLRNTPGHDFSLRGELETPVVVGTVGAKVKEERV
jgi:hypothetical protein